MFEQVTVTVTPNVEVGVAPGVGAGVAVGVGATVGEGVAGREVGVTVEPHAARPTAAIVVPMMVVGFMSARPWNGNDGRRLYIGHDKITTLCRFLRSCVLRPKRPRMSA